MFDGVDVPGVPGLDMIFSVFYKFLIARSNICYKIAEVQGVKQMLRTLRASWGMVVASRQGVLGPSSACYSDDYVSCSDRATK